MYNARDASHSAHKNIMYEQMIGKNETRILLDKNKSKFVI